MLRPIMLAFVCAAAVAAPALAEVDISLDAKKRVVTKDMLDRRSVKLVEPGTAVPGDEIVYSVRLANRGKAAADKIRFVTPIPAELAYWAGSAEGGDAEAAFSIDGGKTFDLPSRLFVTDASGKKRLAEAWEYTHIQWRLPTPLPAAQVRTVTFHAVVR